MSLGLSTACGAVMVSTPTNPQSPPASPWYSPIRWFGAVRRSNGPARCPCRQVAPPSPDWANHASVVSSVSPGRSLRMSYQLTPTVPCPSTAMTGSNANADTPGSWLAVQVRPPSRDCDRLIAPAVGELLPSAATYTVPSGAIAGAVNPGCGSSTPLSGSVKTPTGCTATGTAASQVVPSSADRLANNVPSPVVTSKLAHTASR